MRILDRYIMSSVLTAIALILLILIGIESFVGLMTELAYVGTGSYGIVSALQYVFMLNPLVLYEFFPIACLLGSLVGLGGLASTQQLVAMRASGFSIRQLMYAVIKVAIILSVLGFFLGECVASQWAHKATVHKNNALGVKGDSGALDGVWLKKGDSFIHIDTIISASEIHGVVQYLFTPANKLQTVINSVEGHLVGETWHLKDSKITEFSEQKISVKPVIDQVLNIKIKPNLISLMDEPENQKSIKDLFRSYHYRQQLGLSYTSLELVFWQKVLRPLTMIVMICLGVPFVFGSLRDSSMGTRLVIGGLLGFGFYMLNQFSGRVAIAVHLAPLLAAVLPIVVFACLAFFLLRRIER